MNENPQNQNNNNDLDSLLEEFQNLSTPVENQKPMSDSNQGSIPVTQSVPVQPVPSVEPVQSAPVQPSNPVQPTVSTQPVQSAPVQPVRPVENSSQPTSQEPMVSKENMNNIEEPMIHPDMKIKLNDLGPDAPTETVGNNTPVIPEGDNKGSKGNLIFMIVIFLIMAVFIFFIPTIDDFIKNKPGKEAKPTPTPTASATPTATPVAKEVKTNCTVEDVVNGDVTTKTSYTYQSLNGKVTKTNKTVVTKFTNILGTNQDAYNQTKLICDSLPTTYAGINGYTVTCEEKDNAFTVVYSFDLNLFTNPTTITLNGQPEVIKSDVNLNDDIKTVKANMTSVGGTCK